MCLGAGAAAANENARRRYKYELERRERNWMQTTSIYKAKKLKYTEDTQNLGLAQAQVKADQQEQMDLARGEAQLKYRDLFENLLKDSKYSKLVASGQTGKSTQRIATMEFAKYGRNVSDIARALVLNDRELGKKAGKAISGIKAQKENAFASVAFQPIPDVAPPEPVMQNETMAAFMDALSIGTSIATMGGSSGFKWWE